MWATAINNHAKTPIESRFITENMLITTLIHENSGTDACKKVYSRERDLVNTRKASGLLDPDQIRVFKRHKSIPYSLMERKQSIPSPDNLPKNLNQSRIESNISKMGQHPKPTFDRRLTMYGDRDVPYAEFLSNEGVEIQKSPKSLENNLFFEQNTKKRLALACTKTGYESYHLNHEKKDKHGLLENDQSSDNETDQFLEGEEDESNDDFIENTDEDSIYLYGTSSSEDEKDERNYNPKLSFYNEENKNKSNNESKKCFRTFFGKDKKIWLPLNNELMTIINDASTLTKSQNISNNTSRTIENFGFKPSGFGSLSDTSLKISKNFEKIPIPFLYQFSMIFSIITIILFFFIVYKYKQNDLGNLLFNPDNKSRLIWNLLCALIILYQVLIMPLRISFSIDDPNSNLEKLDFVIDLIFIFDILLNFNTAYYKKGALIDSRKQIALHYMKKWFWIDLIASFPYSWVIDNNFLNNNNDNQMPGTSNFYKAVKILRFLKILRLIRILKLKKIFGSIEGMLSISPSINTFLGFLKITIIILMIAHWIACLWHLVGNYEFNNSPNTWISKAGISDAPWSERYLASMYWAVETMMTVGYGDITPATQLEMVVTICIELISSGLFAFSMNTINTLLTNMASSSTSYRQKISTIHHYMKRRCVGKEVRQKVRKFLEYALDNEGSKIDEKNLTALLSENLKQELITEINGRTLINFPIFMNNFSERFLMEVTLIMKENIFGADEIIFREDKIEDPSIYFILAGSVAIFSLESSALLQNLEKNKCFGELEFFTGMNRMASAKSTMFTEVHCIQRNDFLKLLDRFPEEKERYCMIKDQINIYEDYGDMHVKCYSCNKLGHLVMKCPEIHYQIDRESLVREFLEAEEIFRKEFVRQNRRIKSTISYYEYLKKSAENIQANYKESLLIMNYTVENEYLPYSDQINHYHSEAYDLGNQDAIYHPLNLLYPHNATTLSATPKIIEIFENNSNLGKNLTQSLLSREKSSGFVNKFQLSIRNPDIIYEFSIDSICQYKNYFPKNNLDNILQEILDNKKLREKELDLLKNLKTNHHNTPEIHKSNIPLSVSASILEEKPKCVHDNDAENLKISLTMLNKSNRRSRMKKNSNIVDSIINDNESHIDDDQMNLLRQEDNFNQLKSPVHKRVKIPIIDSIASSQEISTKKSTKIVVSTTKSTPKTGLNI